MAKVQKIVSPGGEAMVVLPEADYERLCEIAEDHADSAAANRVLDDIAAGREEFVPAEFANRILEGESPVRVYREWRGLTGQELAERIGVSQGYLSQIETGKRQGKIGAYRAIADALGASVDDLI